MNGPRASSSGAAGSLMVALAASMERSREVSRIGRVLQKPPAARTLPELALVVAELAKVALVAEASPELQQDVAAVARLVVLEEAQALRLPQDCKGGAALVYVLKGKVEARAKQRGPFEDSAEAEQQQAPSAPSSPRSKAGRLQGVCDMSRAGSMGGDGCSRKRRSGSISSDEDHATGHRDSGDEQGSEDETGEGEEEQEEEEEETVAGIPIVHLRELFDSIDVDGSGEIDADELHGALRKMGMRKSPAEVQELLLMADPDGSGELGFDEFCFIVRVQLEEQNGGGQKAEWRRVEGTSAFPWRQHIKGRQCVGQAALQQQLYMDGLVVALEETQLLVLDAAAYQLALTQGFSATLALRTARLCQVPLLAACALPAADWRTCAAALQQREVARQAAVYEAGQAPDALYFIVEGSCKLLASTVNATRQVGSSATDPSNATGSSSARSPASAAAGSSSVAGNSPRLLAGASAAGGLGSQSPATRARTHSAMRQGPGAWAAAAATAAVGGSEAGTAGTDRRAVTCAGSVSGSLPEGRSSTAGGGLSPRFSKLPQEVALLGPGDLCGEALLLGQPSHTYTLVTVSTGVVLLQLKASDLPLLAGAVNMQKLRQRLVQRDEQRAQRLQQAAAAASALQASSRRVTAAAAVASSWAGGLLDPEGPHLKQTAAMLQQQLSCAFTPGLADASSAGAEDSCSLAGDAELPASPRTPRFVGVGSPRAAQAEGVALPTGPFMPASSCGRQDVWPWNTGSSSSSSSSPVDVPVTALSGAAGGPGAARSVSVPGLSLPGAASSSTGRTVPQPVLLQPSGRLLVSTAARAAAVAKVAGSVALPASSSSGGSAGASRVLSTRVPTEGTLPGWWRQPSGTHPAACATPLDAAGHLQGQASSAGLQVDQQPAAALCSDAAHATNNKQNHRQQSALSSQPPPLLPQQQQQQLEEGSSLPPSQGHDVGCCPHGATNSPEEWGTPRAVSPPRCHWAPSTDQSSTAAGHAATAVDARTVSNLPGLRLQTGGPYLFAQWDLDSWFTTTAAADLASWGVSRPTCSSPIITYTRTQYKAAEACAEAAAAAAAARAAAASAISTNACMVPGKYGRLNSSRCSPRQKAGGGWSPPGSPPGSPRGGRRTQEVAPVWDNTKGPHTARLAAADCPPIGVMAVSLGRPRYGAGAAGQTASQAPSYASAVADVNSSTTSSRQGDLQALAASHAAAAANMQQQERQQQVALPGLTTPVVPRLALHKLTAAAGGMPLAGVSTHSQASGERGSSGGALTGGIDQRRATLESGKAVVMGSSGAVTIRSQHTLLPATVDAAASARILQQAPLTSRGFRGHMARGQRTTRG